MITNLNQPYDAGNYYMQADKLVGLSTDEKPINVGNGTTLYEMDTKDEYMFDADGATWYKIVGEDSSDSGNDTPDSGEDTPDSGEDTPGSGDGTPDDQGGEEQ